MYYDGSIIKKVISYFFSITIASIKTKEEHLKLVLENGALKLFGNDANYSFGELHRVFEIAFKKINIVQLPPKNVLILGFGVGSVAHILNHQYNFNCNITGVDNNENVLSLFQKYFEPKYNSKPLLIKNDALKALQNLDTKFDLITVDIFVGLDIPHQFKDEIFVEELKKHLEKNGAVLYNFVTENKKQQASFNQLTTLFSKHFNSVEIIGCSESNQMIYAKNISL